MAPGEPHLAHAQREAKVIGGSRGTVSRDAPIHTQAYRQEAWGDPLLLVVPRSVARQLQHLRTQVLQHGGEVHGGALAHPRGVATGPDQRRGAPHREGQPRLLGPPGSPAFALLASGLGSLLVLATFRGWRGRHWTW